MPSFAGARARVKSATQDIFHLPGGNSSAAPAAPVPESKAAPAQDGPLSSARKPEASIMFSLEELMKAAPPPPAEPDESFDQLWNMQAATPLFGTAHDQALLTTPLRLDQMTAPDSMTVPSSPSGAQRRWPLLLAAAGTCAIVLGGAGFWLFGSPTSVAAPAAITSPEPLVPAAEHAALSAKPPEPAVEAKHDVNGEPTPSDPADPGKAADPAPPAAEEAKPAEAASASGETAKASVEESAPTPSKSDAKGEGRSSASTKRERTKKVVHTTMPNLAKIIAPFDTDAAREALNEAAAKAAECHEAGGPAGKGKVQLTFANSGRVSSASIGEGPFAGTSAGNCALRYFRAVHVPGFSGSPQTVTKSFKIQ